MEKEKQRKQEEKKKIEAEIERASKMLANPGFVNKAPAAKIQEEREKLEKYKDLLEKAKADLVRCQEKYSDLLNKDDLKDLKMPISGGEQLKYEKEQQINEALYNAGCNSTLWNGLGMSEMWAPVSVKRGNINSDTTIGTMIPFTNAKIVDINTGNNC